MSTGGIKTAPVAENAIRAIAHKCGSRVMLRTVYSNVYVEATILHALIKP